MQHPRVIVLGYSEAAMYLKGDSGSRVTGIISIYGQREYAVETQVLQHLKLRFDDIDSVLEGDWFSESKHRLRKRRARQYGLDLTAPTEDDVVRIVNFAKSVRNAGGDVLCHCGAGISRSAAAALICLAVWQGPGREQNCMDEILRVRSAATPHVGLVRFADKVLNRNGNLVSVLHPFNPEN